MEDARDPEAAAAAIPAAASTTGMYASASQLYHDSRMSFGDEYERGMAGVEGGMGAQMANIFSRDSTNLSISRATSTADEEELIQVALNEIEDRATAHATGRPYKARPILVVPGAKKRYIPKSRKHLQRLEEEMVEMQTKAEAAGVAGGEFRQQIMRLTQKYNVHTPQITLHYNNLTVETDALMGSAGIPTVGNSFINSLRGLVGIKPPHVRHTILSDIRGVLLPARLTLLLGPPASGKSTFLKVLAGRYQDSKTLSVKGALTYNGRSFKEFDVNRTSCYVSQHDVHIPLLSVWDTLQFAYICQQGYNAPDFHLLAEIKRAMDRTKNMPVAEATEDTSSVAVDIAARNGGTLDDLEAEVISLGENVYLSGAKVSTMMRAFGIGHTKDTPVGDAMLRGVSGGERKRVTVAEMLVGPRHIMFLDEISTGLDSATLFSIITLCKEYNHCFKSTMLVSLLQPPPEVYMTFDDVILMSEGHMVYHGPVQQAMPFFESLGFVCPPRKDIPSFLQEVTTPAGQLEYASNALLKSKGLTSRDPEYAYVHGFIIPVEEVVARFWASKEGKEMQAMVDTPYDMTASHPAALIQTRYALSPLQMLVVVTQRQLLLVAKDPILIKGRMIQIVILGLLLGGLFFQLEHTVATSRSVFGALFVAVMFVAMGAMPQLSITMASKPVWYKMRDAQFYPGWVHATASALAQVPVSILDSMAWSIITYFMWGLYVDAAYFFTYFLIIFATNTSIGALFRLVAHMAPDGVAANSYGGLVFLILVVMSGFSIVRGSIPPWWIWAYYISPFAWALRAIVINEMTSPAWAALSPTGSGLSLGIESLLSFDFFVDRKWIWAGIGFMFGSAIFFTALSAVALQYMTPVTVARVADAEAIAEARRVAAERKAAQATDASRRGSALTNKGSAPVNRTSLTLTQQMSSTPHQLLAQPCAMITESSMPFTRVTLVFQDLRYFVPNPSYTGKGKGKGKEVGSVPVRLELLKGITGHAEAGQLTALMGGSGAGKTTLMDCIAGRKTVGEITGNILVNGHVKEQATWSRVVGYCEQMDIHTPAQTVIEALWFSARLRLPSATTDEQVKTYVDEILGIVDLVGNQFDMVGLPGMSGLNVEQRKRLTIAVELVASPSVVFMDEPTSGLDARAAAIVMRAVRNVARNGRAVLVTIHQPSIEIFESFDNLLLLQRGGRTTYFGPLGKESCHLVAYLQAVPGCPEIAPGYNPATWMLEVTGGAVSVAAKTVDVDWPGLYEASALAATNKSKGEALASVGLATHPPLTVTGGRYAATFQTQVNELRRKYQMAYWRTPSYNLTRYLVTVLVAILYGSVYYKSAQLPNPAQLKDVQNVMGVIYSSTSFMGMTNMMAAMPIVGLERIVFYRERSVSAYSTWAYGIVMAMVETPYIITQVVLFVCIMYPMVGYISDAGKFFWYVMMTFQSISFYTALGVGLIYLTPSQQLGQVAAAGLNFLWNIFNGFVITYPAMALGFKWLNRISPTTWLLYGLISDQLGDSQVVFDYPSDRSITTVAEFLEVYFGYKYSIHWFTPLMVLAYIMAFRVGGVLALRYTSFLKR